MRRKSPSLRGSVTQTTVRVRPRETSRLGFLMRAGIAAGVLVGLMLTGVVAWRSGWIHRQSERLAESVFAVTQKAHFAVGDIVVEGRKQTDKDQLFAALEASSKSPIFAFDPHEAAARIAKLPWVEGVTVERRLPDTIFVRLAERMPLARWQHDNHIIVVDVQGKPLPDTDPDHFEQLPLVVGAGAPTEAKSLFDTLRGFPAVEQKMTAAVRVGERRWDIHLDPKIVARLPETDVSDALKRLAALITEQKILERDIAAIDLRVPDRLIIESNTTATPPQHPTGERL